MTADIEIVTQEKENVLTLSSSAITSEDDKYYVNVVKSGKPQKTEIKTWLSSWWVTEIISWVNLWDKIAIIDISTTTTSTTKTSSLFPTGRNSSSSKSSGNMSGPPGGF